MQKDKKVIFPMMLELNETIKDTVYYVSLPKVVKEKWIELESKSKSTYNPMYNLPTVTLKKMLSTYLDGVIDMNPVSNSSNENKWLVSFKDVNVKIVVNCFKIWVDEFYIKGVLTKDYKRKNGRDENINRIAKELIELLTPETFGKVSNDEVILFDGGKAIGKEGYQLYPLRIVNSLMGKSILISGIETKLLYSNSNELVTDTHDFHNEDDYYSFVIRLSVQTLPPENKAYLNVDLSVRRWISRNEKNDGKIYLPNDKNCYIRVKGDRLQSIKTEYDKELKENYWKSIDFKCFKECQVDSSNIPKFTEVLERPKKYNSGKVGDVLIPYEEGIEGIETTVKSGVTFMDRKTAFEVIKKQLSILDNISSNVEAVNVNKVVRNRKNSFYEDKDPFNIKSDYFLKQLGKALDDGKLTIEIYAESEVRNSLMDRLNFFMENSAKHEVKFCEVGNICEKLVKTPDSKKENLPGFELKKEEIISKLNKVKTPTLSLIAIHDKAYFSRLDRQINVDPKTAIRCGFAETGRLTQFITYEEFEKAEKRIERSDEIYEKKKETAQKNNKNLKARSKSDKLNKSINGAVWDGFRQLGVVFDYEIHKNMKGKKIVGIHVCNYKKTFYGNIPLLPIILTYDVDNSKIMVYCDLIDKVDVPYWKGILGLSKLASAKNIKEIIKGISKTTLYRRLDRIINKEDSSTIIVIDANGTTRQTIKGISNSEIEKVEKNEFKQVTRMLINDDRYIDFAECPNELGMVRLRHNAEVSSYFTMDNGMEKKKFIQQSGIYHYNGVYYSIDGRPSHENEVYDKQVSKANDKSSFSHRNMLEIFPIYVSGDHEKHDKNEKIAIGIVDLLRNASIQFTPTQKTILPLPLHLAAKMEEYL